jgi:SAM-dependent methyltransferase
MTTITPAAPPTALSTDSFPLCCWSCGGVLNLRVSGSHLCDRCGAVTLQEEGIWRSLSPDLAESFDRFIAEYEFIREAEARGSNDPAYYLALPYNDITGKLAAQWKIRAATYRHLERKILSRMQKRPLRILDLGAGNGWLSYRLSLLGHQPVAVDILTNNRDGLGAAAHYAAHLPSMFPRVQASVDHLPFPNAIFDLAIFNASFHYSADYTRTLAEALRCICPRGEIVIADSPWYRHESSGTAMVEEKHAHFRSIYGFASNSLASQEFLTPQRLDALATALSIRWQILKPFHGVHWALRPLRAKLKGRRTPSEFRIFMAEVPA